MHQHQRPQGRSHPRPAPATATRGAQGLAAAGLSLKTGADPGADLGSVPAQ
ncbi:hypothetical protein [Streptomyces sp. NPDC052701]|uniref:hypothetical protein n=1 Tax=Streptomyces sp. NPDC052701 TaxID=3155533 RepID=UPI003437EFEB